MSCRVTAQVLAFTHHLYFRRFDFGSQAFWSMRRVGIGGGRLAGLPQARAHGQGDAWPENGGQGEPQE